MSVIHWIGMVLVVGLVVYLTVALLLLVKPLGCETQKIAALDAGADDYVTKPFSAPELLACVRARGTAARSSWR